ncbi:MAG: thiamine pyrophosphate-binding protein, partial [Thermacetogeniaceae bacterium]
MSEPLYGNPKRPYGFELITDVLVEQNVECIFSLAGNSTVSLLKTIEDKGIEVVGCRTEQGAVLAATGYAVSSGRVGVAILTAGYSNVAHLGMLNAARGHVPVVVIAGCNATTVDELRSQQEYDQKPMAKSADVKAAYHVARGERIPQMLSWAFNAATSGIPGVAFIDIAQDVIKGQIDAASLSDYPVCNMNAKTYGDPGQIRKAIDLLTIAKKPAIYVGRLGEAPDISDELKELVNMTGIPVDTLHGVLGSHPLNLPNCAGQADVILMVGKANAGYKTEPGPCQYTGKIISVYPDTVNFGHSYPIEIGIAGDVKLVMKQIVKAAKGIKFPDYSPWVKQLTDAREGMKTMLDRLAQKHMNDNPIHPAVAAKKSCDFILRHDIYGKSVVVIDGADSMVFYLTYASSYGIVPQYPGQIVSMITIENATAVGLGLAMAVGAATAHPDKLLYIPVVGDGSLGYNLAEIETLARLNVPAVIVVWNNNSWGMVWQDMRRIYGRNVRSGCFFSDEVHYEKVGEGLGGINGGFIKQSGDLSLALDKAYEMAMRE